MKDEILLTPAKLPAPEKHTVPTNWETQSVLIELPFPQTSSHKGWMASFMVLECT